MREILFRGKRCKTEEWVYGLLWHNKPEAAALWSDDMDRCLWVHPETVGQFTGLTDQNGKKIFEGDILEERIRGRPLKDGTPGYKTRKYIVRCGAWSFYLEAIGASGRPSRCVERCKIIGNIHDNPELLEKGGT